MPKTNAPEGHQELQLLEALQEAPEARQADLAAQIGVSVGSVNWHLKRLANKGLIKIKQIGRWRWEYLLTPKGVAEKATLTSAYVKNSMTLYRQTRMQALIFFQEIRAAGFEHVRLSGEGELVEVCRLTCLEQSLKVLPEHVDTVPMIRQDGLRLRLLWPENLDELTRPNEPKAMDERA